MSVPQSSKSFTKPTISSFSRKFSRLMTKFKAVSPSYEEPMHILVAVDYIHVGFIDLRRSSDWRQRLRHATVWAPAACCGDCVWSCNVWQQHQAGIYTTRMKSKLCVRLRTMRAKLNVHVYSHVHDLIEYTKKVASDKQRHTHIIYEVRVCSLL